MVNLRVDQVPVQEEPAASDERVTGEAAELVAAEAARDPDEDPAAAKDAASTAEDVAQDACLRAFRAVLGPFPELARSAPQPRRRRFRTTRRAGRRRAPSPR